MSYGGSFNAATYNSGAINADPQAFVTVSGVLNLASTVGASIHSTLQVTGNTAEANSVFGYIEGGIFMKVAQSGYMNNFPMNFVAFNESFQTFLTGDVAAQASSAPSIQKTVSDTGSVVATASTPNASIHQRGGLDADIYATTALSTPRPYIAFAINGATNATATTAASYFWKINSVVGDVVQSQTVTANVGDPAVFQIFARGSITIYPLATLNGPVHKLCAVEGAPISAGVVIP